MYCNLPFLPPALKMTLPHVSIRLGKLTTTLSDSDIIIHNNNSLSSLNPKHRICRVCTKTVSRYTCPRCNIPYCALDCYQTHGLECTEAFAKQHVENEMKEDEKEKVEKEQSMQKILHRVHASSSSISPEEIKEEAWITRFQQLANKDNLNVDALSESEREAFLKDVHDGKCSAWIEAWRPWWEMSVVEYEKESRAIRKGLISLIIDNKSDHSSEPEEVDGQALDTIAAPRLPQAMFTDTLRTALPPFTTLCSKPPSPTLPFNVLDILYAYAKCMRVYNGNWKDCSEEVLCDFIALSSVLSKGAVHGSRDEALESSSRQLQIVFPQSAIKGREEHTRVVTDLVNIISEKTFVLDALCDVLALLQNGKISTSKTRRRKKDASQRLEKKVYFYLVFVHQSGIQNLYK